MPVLVALCVLLEGMFFMAVTKPGHVPDIWTHVYRIDSILNGDVIARPVTSRSMLHNTETGVVGGAVDRSWMQYSLDQYDGYDPGIVIAESVADNGSSTTVDLPFNNTATNSPVVYAPQLLGFRIGRVFNFSSGMTYRLAEACMLIIYVLFMYGAVRALPRWRIPVGILLCFPLMVFRYSFAISADSLTQAVMILFSCLLFRGIIGKRSQRGAVALAVTSVLLAMCKFVYMPLVLLVIPLMFDRSFRSLACESWSGCAIVDRRGCVWYMDHILVGRQCLVYELSDAGFVQTNERAQACIVDGSRCHVGCCEEHCMGDNACSIEYE